MRQPLACLLAMVAVSALGACAATEPNSAVSASPCSRYDELVNKGGLLAKVTDCPAYTAWIEQGVGTVDMAACEKASEQCTSADENVIAKRLECLAKLPNCVAGKEADFAAAWSACDSTTDVSAACEAAVQLLGA